VTALRRFEHDIGEWRRRVNAEAVSIENRTEARHEYVVLGDESGIGE
jgi:hypothetical protein